MPAARFLVGTRRTIAAPAAQATAEIVKVGRHYGTAGHASAPPRQRRSTGIGLQRLKPGLVNHPHSRLVSPSRDLPRRSDGHDHGLHHMGPIATKLKLGAQVRPALTSALQRRLAVGRPSSTLTWTAPKTSCTMTCTAPSAASTGPQLRTDLAQLRHVRRRMRKTSWRWPRIRPLAVMKSARWRL
jgi:hypothetical protein